MDIFALNNLLIVSLSVFRLSDARARARRAGVVPIFDPLPNYYSSRWNRYLIA